MIDLISFITLTIAYYKDNSHSTNIIRIASSLCCWLSQISLNLPLASIPPTPLLQFRMFSTNFTPK